MKEFQDRADFCTITMALHQDPQVRKTVRTDVEASLGDNGPGFFTRLGESRRVGWQWGRAETPNHPRNCGMPFSSRSSCAVSSMRPGESPTGNSSAGSPRATRSAFA